TTGIANISSTLTFVTCSMQAQIEDSEFGPGTELAAVSFTNRSGADTTVNCTMVTTDRLFNPTYFSKSLALPVGGRDFLYFRAAESGGYFGDRINFSCALPPGVEVNQTRRDWQEAATDL
ncbi:MAG: hypothetical protein JWL98_1527, partial [Xanthomonadaceae bacterium]|nr:hypothetical protein [Xanthomonadaceae bacterium]